MVSAFNKASKFQITTVTIWGLLVPVLSQYEFYQLLWEQTTPAVKSTMVTV